MKIKPARRVLIRDQLLEQLREMILVGELSSGERLVEMKIAKAANVSQAPVREAIQALAREGLVAMRDHKGATVTPFSVDDMFEVFEVRGTIESLAVRKALEHISEDALETLQASYDAMKAAAEDEDWRALVDADIQFHRTVVVLSGHELLLKLWDVCDIHIRRFLHTVHPHFFSLHELADIHVPLLEHLRAADEEAAVEGFSHHMRIIWDRYEAQREGDES